MQPAEERKKKDQGMKKQVRLQNNPQKKDGTREGKSKSQTTEQPAEERQDQGMKKQGQKKEEEISQNEKERLWNK